VFGGVLSTSQLIAILLVVGAGLILPYLAKTQRVNPAPA
jgi:hypothetical protein